MKSTVVLGICLLGSIIAAVGAETDDNTLFKCGKDSVKKVDELDTLADPLWGIMTGKGEPTKDLATLKKKCAEGKTLVDKVAEFGTKCMDGYGQTAIGQSVEGTKITIAEHCADDKAMNEYIKNEKCAFEKKAAIQKVIAPMDVMFRQASEEEAAGTRVAVFCKTLTEMKEGILAALESCPEPTKDLVKNMWKNIIEPITTVPCVLPDPTATTAAKVHSRKAKTIVPAGLRAAQKGIM